MVERQKPRMLSIKDITEEYKFSEYTVRQWIWEKRVPYIRTGKGGGKYYIAEPNLIEFLYSREA